MNSFIVEQVCTIQVLLSFIVNKYIKNIFFHSYLCTKMCQRALRSYKMRRREKNTRGRRRFFFHAHTP